MYMSLAASCYTNMNLSLILLTSINFIGAFRIAKLKMVLSYLFLGGGGVMYPSWEDSKLLIISWDNVMFTIITFKGWMFFSLPSPSQLSLFHSALQPTCGQCHDCHVELRPSRSGRSSGSQVVGSIQVPPWKTFQDAAMKVSHNTFQTKNIYVCLY